LNCFPSRQQSFQSPEEGHNISSGSQIKLDQTIPCRLRVCPGLTMTSNLPNFLTPSSTASLIICSFPTSHLTAHTLVSGQRSEIVFSTAFAASLNTSRRHRAQMISTERWEGRKKGGRDRRKGEGNELVDIGEDKSSSLRSEEERGFQSDPAPSALQD
jgi:hypothetical protein